MTHYTLAFDTTANSVSIAILDGQKCVDEVYQQMDRGQGEALLPMIISLLQKNHLSMADMGKIAVAVGPGSFTGVRVGLSAARGMGLALSVPVCGISTLTASAYQTKGIVLAVSDTKRGDFYTQLFQDGSPIEKPTIRTIADIQNLSFSYLSGPSADLVAPEVKKEALTPKHSLAVAIGQLAETTSNPPEPLYLREADVSC